MTAPARNIQRRSMLSSLTPKAAALKVWELGANVTSIGDAGKEPLHQWNSKRAPWCSTRQKRDIVESLPWDTTRRVYKGQEYPPVVTFGIISGINGWRVLDADALELNPATDMPLSVSPLTEEQIASKVKTVKRPIPESVVHAMLDALALSRDYDWHGRSRSTTGWHIVVRCDEDLPTDLAAAGAKGDAGVKVGTPNAAYRDAFDHLELRWNDCQTVIPACAGYTARTLDAPPAVVTAEQIRAAFSAIATTRVPNATARAANATPAPSSEPKARTSNVSGATREESVIAAFNASHSIYDMLDQYGYVKQGDRYFNPEADRQHAPGVVVFDGGICYFFDATSGLHREVADSFSMFRHHEHHGDMRAAVKAAAELLKMDYASNRKARPAPAKQNTNGSDRRAEVIVNDLDIPIIAAQVWDALVDSEADDPTLYQRGGMLVNLNHDDTGRRIVKTMAAAYLSGTLARCCTFIRLSKKKDELARTILVPPKAIVDDCMTRIDSRIPILSRIVHTPTFAPDGTLLDAPGYHAISRVYYEPSEGLHIPRIASNPTESEMDRARALLLDDLLADFPFVEEADRAHAVALALLPFVRDMIDGPTPLHFIEAPIAGSGKGLLADVLTTIATGIPPQPMTEANDDDEWRKRITSTLMRAPSHVLLDNINNTLDSGQLASALTALVWEDRILGRSENVALPVSCVWLATANNPTLSTEIARRCIRIRIDPQVDRPWQREGFQIDNLRVWAAERRGELIWACCTLIRYGLQHGQSAAHLGSFESWSSVIGRILAGCGITGFLGNLTKLYEAADTEGNTWRAIVATWYEAHGETPVKAGDVYTAAMQAGIDLGLKGRTEKAMRTEFGAKLIKMADRVVGDYQIVKAGEYNKRPLWKLHSIARNTSNTFNTFTIPRMEEKTNSSKVYRGDKVLKVLEVLHDDEQEQGSAVRPYDTSDHAAALIDQGASEVALAALYEVPEGDERDTLADAYIAQATSTPPEPIRVIPPPHRPNINDIRRQQREEEELARIAAESADLEEQEE